MPARLFLVPPALADRLANRFAVRNARGPRLDRYSVAPLQPCQNHSEMIFVDPAQDRFVAGVVLGPFQRWVFFAQPVQGGRQLDVVLAVAGGDRQRSIARWIYDQSGFAQAGPLAPQHHAGCSAVDFGHGDHIAGPRRVLLGGLVTLDEEQRAGALAAQSADQLVAFAQAVTQHPAQSQPPHRPAIGDLEHMQCPATGHPHPRGRGSGRGHFMAQQFEQPVHPAVRQR